MSRRQPTAHWQRLQSTFQTIRGWRWRAAAAAALGIARSQLRASVDREMTHAELCRIEDAMASEMAAQSTYLVAHVAQLREMQRDVEQLRYRRIDAEARSAEAEETLDEFFTGWAAEAAIREQFGDRIKAEDARNARDRENRERKRA